MTAPLFKQLPSGTDEIEKRDARTQFAALCYRVKGSKVQFLLITSRRTRRWIVPKGWPEAGMAPGDCALREAWEEAGVHGEVHQRPIGIFSYIKVNENSDDLPCVAMVYAVRVSKLVDAFPEADERKRKWCSRKKAAALLESPELARIIQDFDPDTML